MTTLMIDPQSESEVLRATAILLIRVLAVSFSTWTAEGDTGLQRRKANMQVVIEEVLKGRLRQQIDEPFELVVQQRSTVSLRVMDFYGIWSHVTLADGTRLVAFCGGASDDATKLLDEPNCEQLLPPAEALDDTRAALSLDAQNLPTAELLTQAAALAAQRGDIFARYVVAKTKSLTSLPPSPSILRAEPQDVPTTSPDRDFEALITILEDPATNQAARQAYLTSVYEDLGMMAAPPRQRELRLARAMFRIFALPQSGALRATIVNVYLPNLLGLSATQPKYTAGEVFADSANERVQHLEALRRNPQQPSVERLIRWLEAKHEP
jgi:hypothetical protein